ncbi:hypothetical protein LINGRAHAP2_LOCUS25339 [Linum grandiflorum]
MVAVVVVKEKAKTLLRRCLVLRQLRSRRVR